MKKSIVILDPFPRTLDLMFSKKKLKILKSKYQTITAPKKNKKNFYKKNIHRATFIMGQPDLNKKLLINATKLKWFSCSNDKWWNILNSTKTTTDKRLGTYFCKLMYHYTTTQVHPFAKFNMST